jgi:hypothetical protein
LLSFDDQELAALRTAAAALPPGQRDRFLKTVASALGCCVAIGPGTVAQIATAIQQRLLGACPSNRKSLNRGDRNSAACQSGGLT